MNPLRARYSKIERLIPTLLLECDVTRPAVPIDKIVKRWKLSVRYGNLGDVSGLLVRKNGTATIGVNQLHPLVRQRFTIAHEFGHYLLHHGISEHVDRDFKVNYRSAESSTAKDVEEIEANFFAASILMPKDFLDRDEAVDALDNDARVEKLASRYNVSRHAMSLRLANVYGKYRPF